jgi:tetratricopeptide (TPR) repeat protein
MESPTEQEVILRPKATQEIPLKVVFSDQIMRQADDRPSQVQIAATYQSQRLPRTEKKVGQCVVYRAGAIDWGQGVEQAAAFVTAQDPVVDAVAREAARLSSLSGDLFGNRNLRFTAALFDALSALGVAYVPDPNNPYSAMSEMPKAVDTVHYPRETLEKRTGDCDDTTVLMAALLANIGVPTKFIDVPGHIFLLVDTGLHERNRLALGLDPSLSVIVGDGVWIPLETTALDKSFSEAWKIGAEEYRNWEARGKIELVDVAEAQVRYAPSELPGAPALTVSLDTVAVRTRLAGDARNVNAWKNDYMTARYGGMSGEITASAQALNEVGHVYFLAGQMDEAREKLEEVLRRDARSALAHNNLGNIYASSGDIDKALAHYQSALEVEPNDAGIWLNIGLVLYAFGDTLNAMEPLAEGVSISGGYAEACRLLGLQAKVLQERGAERGAEGKLSAAEVQSLLQKVLARLPMAGAGRDTTRTGGVAKPKAPSKPMKMRIAGSRAGDLMVLKDYLYWKE